MQKESRLKIGIVGSGTIAGIHAQALSESEKLELYSVYSRSEENARKLGKKHNVRWHTDWEAFISDPELDAPQRFEITGGCVVDLHQVSHLDQVPI